MKTEAREEKANTVDAIEPVTTVGNWSSVLLREPLKTVQIMPKRVASQWYGS